MYVDVVQYGPLRMYHHALIDTLVELDYLGEELK
jgi:hypothetical protein